MIQPKKSVEKMEEYKPPLEGRRGLVRLDFNENTVGPSPKVLDALKNLKDEDIAAYPEYTKFNEKLAKFLGIKSSQLLATNATDEAIMVIMQSYLDKGDEILLPIPTFSMFKFYAQFAEAKINEILYNKDLSFPAKRLLEKITRKTKLVVLVNPNNPTGSGIKREDIVKIIEKAKNSIVLLDEAYVQYSGETCIDLIDKYDNLIIIQTFSKAYGLAGLRLGYIIANEEIIKILAKVRSPYSVNTAALVAATAAMNDLAYVDWYLKQVKASKKIIYDELRKLKIKTYPTEANFLIACFGKKCRDMEEKLKEKGILVRDRSSFPLLNGCLRITIGTKEQTAALIKALKEILR